MEEICTGAIFGGTGRMDLVVVDFLNGPSPSSSEEEARGEGSCWVGGVCLPIEVGALIVKTARLLLVCKRSASLFEICVAIDSSLFG